MGLTCRLLGHSYGEPETEREREERGDEVVVSIRELQVCRRCGDEQVISENKEVTAIRTPEEVGMTEGEAETAAAGFEPPRPKPGATAADDADVDAEAQDAGAAPNIETAPDPETQASAEAETEAEPEPEPTPEHPTAGDVDDEAEPDVTDDAIILDDDEEAETQRDRTQWPDDVSDVDTEDTVPKPSAEGDDAEFIDAEAVEEADAEPASTQTRERGAWPETSGDDEGWDAEPDDGEPVSVSFGGGLTPEGNGSVASSNDEYVEAGDSDEFVRAEETEIGSETPDESIEYYCPNCGHSRGASASSMRAGDICPECKKGYIAEREA